GRSRKRARSERQPGEQRAGGYRHGAAATRDGHAAAWRDAAYVRHHDSGPGRGRVHRPGRHQVPQRVQCRAGHETSGAVFRSYDGQARVRRLRARIGRREIRDQRSWLGRDDAGLAWPDAAWPDRQQRYAVATLAPLTAVATVAALPTVAAFSAVTTLATLP